MGIINIRIKINETEKKYHKEGELSQKEETHTRTCMRTVLKEMMLNVQMWQNIKYKRILWITLFQQI